MDYGTVDYNGQELTIGQQPYLHGQGLHYAAVAYGNDDNEYLVFWPITNADAEDESDCCDWTDYKVKAI